MKTAYYLVAGLALATAGAAFGADDASGATAAAPVAAAIATTQATVQTSSYAQPKHDLTRAEVRAQAIEARRNGTLIETEADMDVAQTTRHYAHRSVN